MYHQTNNEIKKIKHSCYILSLFLLSTDIISYHIITNNYY